MEAPVSALSSQRSRVSRSCWSTMRERALGHRDAANTKHGQQGALSRSKRALGLSLEAHRAGRS